MPSFITPLRTAAAIAALAVGTNAGIAVASASTHAPAKAEKHQVHKTKHHAKKTTKKAQAAKASIEKAAAEKAAAEKAAAEKAAAEKAAAEKAAAAKNKPVTTTTPTTPVTTTTPVATTAATTPATTTTPTTPTTTTTATTPTTPVTTTTPTTTTTTTTPVTTPPASGLAGCTNTAPDTSQPNGQSGTWSPIFDDEFSGTNINTTTWSTDNGYGDQDGATSYSSNVEVAGGCAILTLASDNSGAEITSNSVTLGVGDYLEARIQFAGSGTSVDNWPAFWTAGEGWPASGEQDIFEGAGTATVNYHGEVNGNETQAGPFDIAGTWAGAFHTYGVYRGSNYSDVYWDGKLVATYPTNDNGVPENVLLTNGANAPLAFGASGEMLVDYVREWQQG